MVLAFLGTGPSLFVRLSATLIALLVSLLLASLVSRLHVAAAPVSGVPFRLLRVVAVRVPARIALAGRALPDRGLRNRREFSGRTSRSSRRNSAAIKREREALSVDVSWRPTLCTISPLPQVRASRQGVYRFISSSRPTGKNRPHRGGRSQSSVGAVTTLLLPMFFEG